MEVGAGHLEKKLLRTRLRFSHDNKIVMFQHRLKGPVR
jgi:hypothetical protein